MKKQQNIYRTYVFLLHPTLASDCFFSVEPGFRVLKTGPLAKRFKLSVERLREQLESLESVGFISDLKIDKHMASFKLRELK